MLSLETVWVSLREIVLDLCIRLENHNSLEYLCFAMWKLQLNGKMSRGVRGGLEEEMMLGVET